jgi:hypothetical protein
MKNFIRKKEDFVCEHCGERVKGNGYTDHCPKCLWGKHVDKTVPGDRGSDCQGLMEPTRVFYEKGRYKIAYKCIECNHEFGVKAGIGDSRELLVDMVK